jgi:hypothetical protein
MTSITQICCELERARSHPSSCDEGRSGALLAASCFGCSLVFVSGSVVSVALAAIGRDMGLRADQLQWVCVPKTLNPTIMVMKSAKDGA